MAMIAGSNARDGTTQFAHGTIVATKLKTIAASPIEMVPAGGEGTFLELIGVWLILEAGSEKITETNDNLVVLYPSASATEASLRIECTNFIDQDVDMLTYAGPPVPDEILDKVSELQNKPLRLSGSSDEFGGNSSNDAKLHWRCTYRVHYLFQQ